MIRYEIQLNDTFVYVTAATIEAAIETLRNSMTKTERRWASIIPTGRDIAGY